MQSVFYYFFFILSSFSEVYPRASAGASGAAYELFFTIRRAPIGPFRTTRLFGFRERQRLTASTVVVVDIYMIVI